MYTLGDAVILMLALGLTVSLSTASVASAEPVVSAPSFLDRESAGTGKAGKANLEANYDNLATAGPTIIPPPTILMRPLPECDERSGSGDGCVPCEPDIDGDCTKPRPPPTRPPPSLSATPDMAYQFSPCLVDKIVEKSPVPVSEDRKKELEQEIHDKIKLVIDEELRLPGSGDIEPDVRFAVDCSGGEEKIGVWLGQPINDEGAFDEELDERRQTALDNLDLLAGEEAFGIFVNDDVVRKIGHAAYDQFFNGGPRRLNSDFHPDPHGSYRFRDAMEISFEESSNSVAMRVYGAKSVDFGLWESDANFHITLRDTVSVVPSSGSSRLLCISDSEFYADDALSGGAILADKFSNWFKEDRFSSPIASAASSAVSGGLVCLLMQNLPGMIPPQILIPDDRVAFVPPQKVVLSFTKAKVNADGIFAGGEEWDITARSPDVLVRGQTTINVVASPDRDTISRPYSIEAYDLRETAGNPLDVVWITERGSFSSAATPPHHPVSLTFDIGTEPRQTFTKQVSVRVTDSDGQVVEKNFNVVIKTWMDSCDYSTNPRRCPQTATWGEDDPRLGEWRGEPSGGPHPE